MNFLTSLAIKTTNLFNGFYLRYDEGGGGNGGTPTPPSQSSAVAKKVTEILKVWIGPLFTVIGAIGAVYIIVLAVQYAKAENDNKRAEVKSRIANCAIGVISLLVIGSLCFWVDWQAFANIFGYAKRQ